MKTVLNQLHSALVLSCLAFSSEGLSFRELPKGDVALAWAKKVESAPTQFAHAQEKASPLSFIPFREGSNAFRSSIGFTADPDSFLLGLEWSHYLRDRMAVGPMLQFGVSDDTLILAPSIGFKAVLDFPDPSMERIKPYVQSGIGFAYIDKDGRRGSDDDIGFMVNFGAGVDYFVQPNLSIGSNILFNILPTGVAGENFFFSWQFVTFTFHF